MPTFGAKSSSIAYERIMTCRTHVGEQLPPSPKVAEAMAIQLNLNSDIEVLNALVQKIFNNLRNWIDKYVSAGRVAPIALQEWC